jgi:hypothetical protein
LNAGLALAEIHGLVAAAATTALSTAEQEEKTSEKQQREDQAGRRLLPGAWLARWLHSNVNVVVRQHLQQILVWSEVDLRTTAIGLNDLSGSTVRGKQNSADLILLNRLNKIAVPQRASCRCRVGTVKERRTHNDHYHHEQDVKSHIAPTLVQGSSPLMKEC